MVAEIPIDGAQREFACVLAGARSVALDVYDVREILRDVPAVPLPGAPDLIEGVVDLRGRLLPLVDLARVFGEAPALAGTAQRIAVVEADGAALALRVGVEMDVIAVPAAEVQEAGAEQDARGAVAAWLRRPSAPPLPVLGVAALLAELRRAEMAETDPGGAVPARKSRSRQGP